MRSLFFWNNWHSSRALFYQFALALLALSLLLMGLSAWWGLEAILNWNVLSELQEARFTLDSANVSSPLSAPIYFVVEQFVASGLQLRGVVFEVFAGLFLTGLMLGLTAISTLKGTWYYVGMGVFMFVLVSLQLDAFLGLTNSFLPLGLIVLYAGLNFYFNAFREDIELWKRFAVFEGFTLALWVAGSFSGNLSAYLASYGLAGAVVLSAVFIFWIAVEIGNGLLYLATANRSPNGLQHYSILSLVYLGNVLLIFLQYTKAVDWQVFTFNPFLLFGVSVVLGVWGLRKREVLLAESMPFDTSGAFVYLGLGLVATATVSLAFATANDPLIETFEDTIVYTQLTMGAMFFFYVFFNFGQLFKQGLEIHKVAFKPRLFELYTVRGVALVIMALILVSQNYFPVLQGFAGFYNALGDYHVQQPDPKTAELYYQQALQYEYQNHRSNYSLASLALDQGDNQTAGGYFRQSLLKHPSPYAYAGLAHTLVRENLFFDAVAVLREGLRKFPKSGELANNLGYLYAKTSIADSVYYYYQKAAQQANRPEVGAANVLAFWIQNRQLLKPEGLGPNPQAEAYASYEANQQALSILTQKPSPLSLRSKLPSDSLLDVSRFAVLYNRALAKLPLDVPLGIIARKAGNEDFFNDLLYAQAVQNYYTGDKLEALNQMSAQAAADTTASGKRYQQTFDYWLGQELQIQPKIGAMRSVADCEKALRRYPLHSGILAQVTALLNKQQQPRKAYDALVNALQYRPRDPEVLKLYVMQALRIRMVSYAEEGLLTLMEILPTAEYQAFERVYDEQLGKINGKF
jgi:Tfp pilus assembly protein PilF